MFCTAIAAFAAVAIAIFAYYKWSFTYWEKKKVPFLPPSIPFGNMENPFTRKYAMSIYMKMCYEELKSKGHKFAGLYSFAAPVFMPIAPESFKNVMQNDFEHFVDRGGYYNEEKDFLSAHLFNIGGQKWRNLRTKLTPTFTSGKMKMMFDILVQCCNQMGEAMDIYTDNNEPIDIKDVAARLTTDIIGSCAFGLDCNSFKNPDAEFRKHGKMLFNPLSKVRATAQIIGSTYPELPKLFGVVLNTKACRKFFFNAIDQTVRYRETANVRRNDMLQLLIDMMNNAGDKNQDGKSLTIEEVASQALVFFGAGFETSSTAMSYCLFELSQNQEMQERVRSDINAVLENYPEVTYESLKEMKYLQQVVDETLRKYPPLPLLSRKCVKNYRIPETDIEIEKGTFVYITVLGLHHDEEYFPEPEKFDPERFSDENRKKIKPYTYIPFGDGPRVCIGLRFGMMQVKLGLITLLRKFRFTLNKNTVTPLKMDPYSILTLLNDADLWLDAEKIEN